MTVAELIKELEKQNPDDEVAVNHTTSRGIGTTLLKKVKRKHNVHISRTWGVATECRGNHCYDCKHFSSPTPAITILVASE